jgi:glycerophosphoryl diester phosphodiesterase
MATMPENTLAGIDAAIAAAADGVEVDVRATRDGVPVLLHDATLLRTTGDPRDIHSIEPAQLASVRVIDPRRKLAPQPVPTLAEALAGVAGRCLLVIELKEAGLERAVASLVRGAGAAPWCWIWTFDPEVGVAARAALPAVPVSLLVGRRTQASRYELLEIAVRAGFAGVSLERSWIDEQTVEHARRRGLCVYTWGVNAESEVRQVAALGVDALCSDDAAPALAALRETR